MLVALLLVSVVAFPLVSGLKLTHFEPLKNVVFESFPHLLESGEQHFRLRFESHGTNFVVHLAPNDEIFHSQASVSVFSDGQLVETIPLNNVNSERQLLKGRVLEERHSDDVMRNGFMSAFWAPYEEQLDSDRGWARLTLHQTGNSMDFEGVLSVDGQLFTIKSRDSYTRMRAENDAELGDFSHDFLIYRHSDFIKDLNGTEKHGCGHDHHDFNRIGANELYEQKRIQFQDRNSRYGLFQKRAESGCPTAKKILYMGVAADCTYVENYGGTSGALKQVISDFNQASKIFESNFNIALGIVKVDLQSTCSTNNGLDWNRQCSSGYPIQQRLSDFSRWRGNQNDQLGLWKLMTKCSSGSTVGISWLNMVCERGTVQQGDGYVSGTTVSSVNPNEWLVVTHEIAHSFGAVHDCTSRDCSQGGSADCCQCDTCDCRGKFIMNPTSDIETNQFSPCSVRTICQKSQVLASCLQDPGTQTTITGNQCGNGVKEPGEECDCGPADGPDCKNSKCCQPGTCKLKPPAKCDDLTDGCCSGCQPKSSGLTCRPARGECDVEEKCDGSSGDCPKDQFKPDLGQCTMTKMEGISGSTGGPGQCASGQCTNRDVQCQLRGSLAGVSKECPGFKNQCTMVCQTKQGSACVQVSGFFLDGTACGWDGTCQQGSCRQSFFGSILGWASDNTALAVVIGCVIAIIVVFILWRLLGLCCARLKKPAARTQRPVSVQPESLRTSMSPPRHATSITPPHSASNRTSSQSNHQQAFQHLSGHPGNVNRQSHWVDPVTYNGPYRVEEVDLSNLR